MKELEHQCGYDWQVLRGHYPGADRATVWTLIVWTQAHISQECWHRQNINTAIHSRAEMWRNVECRMVVGTHIDFLWQSCEGGVQIETNHREGTISSRIKTSSTDPFYFNRKSWEGCNQSSNYRPGPGARSQEQDTNCWYQRRWGGSVRNSVAARQGSWSL